MGLEMNGVERIAAERKRQIEEEGWADAHDRRDLLEVLWPWDLKYWKPSPDNRIRKLEKAGALIAAEIDILLRLEEEK